MVGIITQEISPTRRLQAQGLDAIPATTGEVLGATWDDAWARNPGASAARWLGRELTIPTERYLTKDQANERFGIEGQLTFDGPTPVHVARDLHDLKRAELERRSILQRAEGGIGEGAAQIGVGLVASVLDPVNVASAFIPVVGEARYAQMLANAGSAAGRAAVRAGVGAVEGAVGAAVVEPLVYGVARQEQADYHAVDSLMNLTFGAALGGGLHVVGGGVRDLTTPGRWHAPMQDRVEAAPFGDVETATRASIAAVADDRPVPDTVDLLLRDQERRDLGRSYDTVRAAPAGPPADPLVGLLSESEQPLFMRRGAVEEKDGAVTIPGRGDGMVKIIFKDGEGSARPAAQQVTRDDVLRLPDWLRDLEPRVEDQPGKDRYHRIWVVDTEDGRQIKIVASRFSADQQHYVVKMGVNGPERLEPPSPPRQPGSGEAGSPGGVSRVAGDTAQGTSDRPSGGQSPEVSRPAPRNMGRRRTESNLGEVYDTAGRRLNVRYEVTELGSLTLSHGDDLSVNPHFPQELQPRDRTRAAAEEQIRAIVSGFEPALLGRSRDAATGAPIVGPDGVVESGNGRSLSLRRIYRERPDLATRYQAMMVREGFKIDGIKEPVLIARRITDLSPEERRGFTVDAQKARTLELSASERAMADARVMDGILHLYAGGDPNSAANAPLRRAFLSALPQGEQGALLDGAGVFSAQGTARFRNALLARAFDDAGLIGTMVEKMDDSSRSLSGALFDVAPAWARMRAAAAGGEIAPGVDATADLLDAVRLIRDARAAGRPLDHLLAQMDAFSRPSPATEMFLAEMIRGKTTASRDAIAAALNRYVDEAMKSSPTPDLFGAEPPRSRDILSALRRDDPTAPPPDAAATVAAVERSVADLPEHPTAPEALDAAEALTEARLDELRRAGRLTGEEPELAQAARMAEEANTYSRAAEAGAFCMARSA